MNKEVPSTSGTIDCEVCSMKFKNVRGLRVHSKKHIGNYKCPHCSEGFKKPIDIILHVRHVHGNDSVPYDCIFCEFVTENPSELSQHLQVDHDKLPKYTCTLCKKGFNVYSWFTEHANFHTGEKPFVCELCGKAFPYSRYLSAHKTSMHFEDQHGYAKVHECLICKKTYQHRNSLLVHMNTHTGNVAICDICGKSLSSKEKLKLHYRIHTGYKPFKCQYCEKAFTKKTILVEHERIHTGEKPYQCEHCEKSFSQRTSLVIHVRGHTGERPYVCHICNKGFVARAMLNIHFKSCRGFDGGFDLQVS